MNQEKIGKFISKLRKDKNLTQEQIAEKLGVSDRAVSKWERGLNLPDASLMLDLCNILGINVNELLTGEIIEKNNYMKKAEENLIELKKNEEMANKKLLNFEWVIGLTGSLSFIILIMVASFFEMENITRAILIIIAIIMFIITIISAMKIEREVGYYECAKCHHKYIPSYNSVLFSMHMGRTRYMKCPKCNKKSWNKKVLTK